MRQGFTLVEVLIALAVFALLAAGGTAMLGFTVENQAAVETRMERVARLERAKALLAGDLTQAADRPTRSLDGLSWPAFNARGGGGDGLLVSLVRRGWENPDGAARPSMRYVEYALVQGRLERRTRPMLDGAPLGEPQVLLTGIADAQVEVGFNGPLAPVQGTYRGAPPSAVALTLDTAEFGPVRMAFLVSGS